MSNMMEWNQRVRAMVDENYESYGRASQERLFDILTYERSRGYMVHSGAFIILHEQKEDESKSIFIADYFADYQKLISSFYRTRLGKRFHSELPVALVTQPTRADDDDRFVAFDNAMLGGLYTYADFPLYGGPHGRISHHYDRELRERVKSVVAEIGCEPISLNALDYATNTFGFLAADKDDATLLKIRLAGMNLGKVLA